MTTNNYEVEIDQLLAQRNPEYYNGLQAILSEFQQDLISKNLIGNTSFQSYVGLLQKISEKGNLDFEIDYNLKQKLKELGEGIGTIMPSLESTRIAQKYLNIENSKNFLFKQKVMALVRNEQELNRLQLANLFLEVYTENDFRLPLIKLSLFRLLDPNSDYNYYIYRGKPNPE